MFQKKCKSSGGVGMGELDKRGGRLMCCVCLPPLVTLGDEEGE